MGQELPEGYESPDCSPVSLRDGETPDISAHAQANLSAIREHVRRGNMEETAFERSARKKGLDPEEARALLDEEDDHGA